MKIPDKTIERARAVPIETIARSIPGLKRNGKQLVGPCPVCGGVDRFWADLPKNRWGCRQCEEGGDQIDLVKFRDGVDFGEAVLILANEPAPGKMNGSAHHTKPSATKVVVERYDYQDEDGKLLFPGRARSIQETRRVLGSQRRQA
jgi:phage/plasmid primase-like uncharacterized protein